MNFYTCDVNFVLLVKLRCVLCKLWYHKVVVIFD